MRGNIISKEYKSMKFVKDNNGKEFVCYTNDVKSYKNGTPLSKEQKKQCLDSSQILGDSW